MLQNATAVGALLRTPLDFVAVQRFSDPLAGFKGVKGKGRALDIAPQVDTATAEVLRYMARTKQRRTYLPYIFSQL